MFHIQSLGGVQVRDSVGDVVGLRSKKHYALLVYLASAGRRVYTRDVLARLLWDTPIERARHSLSQAIYDIRRNLPGAIASSSGDAIRLDTHTFRFDVTEFEQALKAGDLRVAVDLFRGPFADNLVNVGTDDLERWAEAERLRLTRLGELALRRHARQCDESGQWGEMCVAALRLVKLSPLDEEAHRALMRGLWLHGDAASAMRHYEDVVQPLESELPGGISEETRLLVRRIRSTPAPEPWDDNLGELQTPFLGREAELESLRASARDIRSHAATAVLIAGEAGIGKTRLTKEFVRSIALEELQLLQSRCYPAEADVPYGPVVDGLRPLATELSRRPGGDLENLTRIGHLLPEFEHLTSDREERVDPAAWRRRLYEEVTELLRVALADRSIVWVIEDVQWMDATSMSLLHYLTRRLEGFPFLLISTIRVARNSELPEALPAMTPGGTDLTTEIRLNPLSSEQIGEILERAAPDPHHRPALELAKRLAGGNPFYALEVFRAAISSTQWAEEASRWDPLTDARLSKVLAIRLKGLSRQSIALLQATAVLERHATPGAVAAVAGLTLPEAADVSADLYSRGLFHDRESRLEFVNDIVREYVYAEMSALQRAALHLTAARHLRSQADANSATLARHYHFGEDRPLTYEYALRAAREAKGSGGQMEAAVMADLAVQSSGSSEERLEALHLLAEAELESAQLARAKEHFNEILRLDQDMVAERRVEVKHGLIRATGGEANWLEADALLSEADRDTRNISDRKTRLEKRFESLNWRLKVATRRNDRRSARTFRDRIIRLRCAAERSNELTEVSKVTSQCSLAAYELFYGSGNAGLEILASLHLHDDLAPHLVQRVRLLRGLGYQRMGDWDRAEYESREALKLALKANDTLQLATVLTNLAGASTERGEWDQASGYVAQATKLHEALRVAHDVAIPIQMNTANLAFYNGRVREARQLYAEVYERAKKSDIIEFTLEVEACLGLTALQIRDYDSARRWISRCNPTEAQLEGIQERFKIDWLWAYANRRDDAEGVRGRLERVAEEQERTDRVSALKLKWLSQILIPNGQMKGTRRVQKRDTRDELASAELGWFIHFSERWLRLASSGST